MEDPDQVSFLQIKFSNTRQSKRKRKLFFDSEDDEAGQDDKPKKSEVDSKQVDKIEQKAAPKITSNPNPVRQEGYPQENKVKLLSTSNVLSKPKQEGQTSKPIERPQEKQKFNATSELGKRPAPYESKEQSKKVQSSNPIKKLSIQPNSDKNQPERKPKTSSEDDTSRSNKIHKKKYDFSVPTSKHLVVYEILKRWWYGMPDWPPKNTNYKQLLGEKGFYIVSADEFQQSAEQDASGKHKVYEIPGFTGLFFNSSVSSLILQKK